MIRMNELLPKKILLDSRKKDQRNIMINPSRVLRTMTKIKSDNIDRSPIQIPWKKIKKSATLQQDSQDEGVRQDSIRKVIPND